MQPESQRETLLRLCGGNEHAVALIYDAWRFAEVMDDAIDGEKREADADIYKAFTWALFDVHRNPFYAEHRAGLELALRVAVSEWMAATRMESSRDREQLVTAYTLRCSPYSFFVAVVLAASGPAAADEAAHFLRSADGPDRLDDYLREHGIGG